MTAAIARPPRRAAAGSRATTAIRSAFSLPCAAFCRDDEAPATLAVSRSMSLLLATALATVTTGAEPALTARAGIAVGGTAGVGALTGGLVFGAGVRGLVFPRSFVGAEVFANIGPNGFTRNSGFQVGFGAVGRLGYTWSPPQEGRDTPFGPFVDALIGAHLYNAEGGDRQTSASGPVFGLATGFRGPGFAEIAVLCSDTTKGAGPICPIMLRFGVGF
jgi:hypothetical protein